MDFEQILKQSCIKIFNELGYGLSELAYEKALSEELREHNLHTQTEVHVNEYYITSSGRKIEVATLRIDILINDKIILELKTTETKLKKYNKDNIFNLENFKETKEYIQCKRYMKITNLNECYLINFCKKGLELTKIN